MASSAEAKTNATTPEEKDRGGKYLTFELGNELYGIEILRVREIIGLMRITTVPQAPNSIRGVINLRGKIIPVVSLRAKFAMPARDEDADTCIIVVDVPHGEETVLTGLIVDSVSEVTQIGGEDIDDVPDLGEDFDASFMLGIAKTDGRASILLNIDAVMPTAVYGPALAAVVKAVADG